MNNWRVYSNPASFQTMCIKQSWLKWRAWSNMLLYKYSFNLIRYNYTGNGLEVFRSVKNTTTSFGYPPTCGRLDLSSQEDLRRGRPDKETKRQTKENIWARIKANAKDHRSTTGPKGSYSVDLNYSPILSGKPFTYQFIKKTFNNLMRITPLKFQNGQ